MKASSRKNLKLIYINCSLVGFTARSWVFHPVSFVPLFCPWSAQWSLSDSLVRSIFRSPFLLFLYAPCCFPLYFQSCISARAAPFLFFMLTFLTSYFCFSRKRWVTWNFCFSENTRKMHSSRSSPLDHFTLSSFSVLSAAVKSFQPEPGYRLHFNVKQKPANLIIKLSRKSTFSLIAVCLVLKIQLVYSNIISINTRPRGVSTSFGCNDNFKG